MSGVDVRHFIDEIDTQIQAKHLLKHPFYQAWSRGELSIECLREYAKDYYSHVDAFCTYLSTIHSRLVTNMEVGRHGSHARVRRILLQNLIEEEAGSPNHPELWKNFAMAIGVSEEELANHEPSSEMKALVKTFRTLCTQQGIVEAISVLYAYEKQVPEICVSKIEGLKQHYGLGDPKSWEYFSVHIDADKEHALQERGLISDYMSPDNRDGVLFSVNQALDALQDFLSGMCKRYHIACES